MPRMLAVLEAGDRYPSGMVRGLIYADLLRVHGFQTTFTARLSPHWLRMVEEPPPWWRRLHGHNGARVARRMFERATPLNEQRIVEQAADCDIVYLSKVLSLPLVQALRQQTKARLVLDFGDAVWLYTPDPEPFHEVLRTVDAVTTINRATADYIRRFNTNVTIIPDSPQLELFDEQRGRRPERPPSVLTIGWLGTMSTTYNLFVIWEALERVFARHPELRLRLVGASEHLPLFDRIPYTRRPFYTQQDMIAEVLDMDIGLFPLQDVERSHYRGVLKATVYMSGETAVIASPIGQTCELIRDGQNGLLAATSAEWEDRLELLIRDATLRQYFVAEGLRTVREGFTLEHCFGRLKRVLLAEDEAPDDRCRETPQFSADPCAVAP
ncbi:MAG: glycosyltransferase family 4 protein [Phycisphaerae bacterium]|jgi:glycosyltransferase involved in cell wall biosynthesis